MDVRAGCAEILRSEAPGAERLRALFDLNWSWRMHSYPEYATYCGVPGHDDRWTDMSLEAIESRVSDLREQRRTLDAIDLRGLGPQDLLDAGLFARQLDQRLEAAEFGGELLAVGQSSGPHTSVAQTLELMRPDAAGDVLARLEGVPRLVDQTIVLLERGIERGITQPRIVLRDLEERIGQHLFDDPASSPLAGCARGAEAEAAKVVGNVVFPAYARLREFVSERYLPACRETTAWTALPGGREWYEHLVRYHTTTSLTPEQIHEIGLSEVARVRAEMEKIVGAEGAPSFGAFCEMLRTDPKFFFGDAESLLVAYRDIAKRIDPQLGRLFGTLPRLPYGVEPVPEYLERSATTAYYQPGSPEAGRPGIFYANTYDLPSRPRWEMEPLTLHEAVPGHHLQIAIAQELADVPEFRRRDMFTAYVEGWALYAESLGAQMGFYQDPHSLFGRYTYEIWRSIRLVVDTGMHALGWERDRAIEYFAQNSPRARHDILVEIDRYIAWAGQALAYKIGELKISELRRLAEDRLGEAFDVRTFHDEILGAGALPLDVLEERIRAWAD